MGPANRAKGVVRAIHEIGASAAVDVQVDVTGDEIAALQIDNFSIVLPSCRHVSDAIVVNPYDPVQNLKGGLSYLRWLLAYYKGNVALAVAAYNAGEAAVDRYKGVPPYPETREYVRRVSRFFPNQRHSFDPSVAEPSPMLTRADKEPASKAP